MKRLEHIASENKTKQKMPKNRSICVICEDFEALFNAVLSSAVVLQRPHYV
jgi:hypothetical protein